VVRDGGFSRFRRSISRKSGHRFSAGNATSVTNLEHDPIRQKRGMLSAAATPFNIILEARP
jgi:hypothetical protein